MSDIDEGQRTVKSPWPEWLAHGRKAIRSPSMVALAGQCEMIKLGDDAETIAAGRRGRLAFTTYSDLSAKSPF